MNKLGITDTRVLYIITELRIINNSELHTLFMLE